MAARNGKLLLSAGAAAATILRADNVQSYRLSWHLRGRRLIQGIEFERPSARHRIFRRKAAQEAGGGEASVALWDIASGKLRTEFPVGSAPTVVNFSSDGNQLAVGSRDVRCNCWMSASASQLASSTGSQAVHSEDGE